MITPKYHLKFNNNNNDNEDDVGIIKLFNNAILKNLNKYVMKTLITNNDYDYLTISFQFYFDRISEIFLVNYSDKDVLDFIKQYHSIMKIIEDSGDKLNDVLSNDQLLFIDSIFDKYLCYCEKYPDIILIAPNPNYKLSIFTMISSSMLKKIKIRNV